MSFLRVLENPRDQLASMASCVFSKGSARLWPSAPGKAVAESGGDVAALEWVPASAPVQAELTKLANLIRSLSRRIPLETYTWI